MADSEGKTEEVVDMGGADTAEQEPTSEEPSSQGEDQQNPSVIASQLMQDPMVLAALQHKLGNMVGGNSGYIQSLPKIVRRRIKALKKLQFEATKVEAEFYREVHRLECEYANKYAPLCEKRATMVSGAYEPTDEEADWPSDDERDELAVSNKETEEIKNKANVEEKTEDGEEKTNEKDEDTKGIPGFWLTIFKNVDMLAEMIQTHDEPILNHLQDVKVEFKEKDPMGFALEFHFEPNDYFENKKLTKEYTMKSEPDEADPFSFEGPEITKCQGCKIDWKKGKNVTVKTVKKKQKHKASGTTRTVSKTVQSDSFFNFFSPPAPPENDEEMDEDTENLLATDFEIGHYIRERIVPRAVLYFTGEALENDDEFEDGEEEEGGEEGDYDEDGDPDFVPGRVKFVSPSFHARVAQLALGRISQPSSAPPDTRMISRPSTAASFHQNVPTQTDLPDRPGTAPVGTEGFNTRQLKEAPFKTKTNAFEETTKSDIPQKYTEKVLTSGQHAKNSSIYSTNENKASGSQLKKETESGNNTTVTDKKQQPVKHSKRTVAVDHAGKSVTADGVAVKGKKQEPLTNAFEPEISSKDPKGSELKITRESTFFKQEQPKIGISREKTFITSRRHTGMGQDKGKTPQLQTLVEVSTSDVDQSCDDGQVSKKNESSGPKPAVPQENRPSASGARSGQTKPKQTTSASQKDKAHVSQGKAPTKETGKTVKEEARSILQRLTGKQSQGLHRAGQVPSVNRPVRKYTFAKPLEKPVKVQEVPEASRKPASAPARHSRNQHVPANRKGVQERRDRYKPPSLTAKSTDITDNRQLGIKPASAPVRNRGPHGDSRSGEKTGNQGKDSQHKGSPLLNRSNKHYPDPKSRIEAEQVAEQGELPKSSGSIQKRGVRMQNAMISGSLEASGLVSLQEGGEEDEWEDEDLDGIHPKLRDSPYLKNNRLLMSKKGKGRPGTGSSASGKQTQDPV